MFNHFVSFLGSDATELSLFLGFFLGFFFLGAGLRAISEAALGEASGALIVGVACVGSQGMATGGAFFASGKLPWSSVLYVDVSSNERFLPHRSWDSTGMFVERNS